MGGRKLTPKIIQQRLNDDGRDITLVEYGGGVREKSTFRCSEGHEWDAAAHSVLQGCGCPHCAGNIPLTPEVIRQRLNDDERGITLVEYGGRTHKKSTFQCSEGHEWSAETSSVLQGCGCPHCAGQVPLTPEIIQQRLDDDGRGIILVEYGSTVNNKSTFQCSEGHEWSAKTSNVIRGRGCPHCAERFPLTPEIIQQRLDDDKRGITLVEYGGNVRKKSTFQCSEGHLWDTQTSSVTQGRGCPHCAKYGYNTSKPGTLYFLRSTTHDYVKVGISNDSTRRLLELKRTTPFYFNIIAQVESEDGEFIRSMEKWFHDTFPSAELTGFDGCTEWLRIEDWQKFNFTVGMLTK